MPDLDRVVSFSVKPENKEGREAIRKLKDYCDAEGKIFSMLVLQAIKELNEKLGLHGTTQGR